MYRRFAAENIELFIVDSERWKRKCNSTGLELNGAGLHPAVEIGLRTKGCSCPPTLVRDPVSKIQDIWKST